MTVLLHFPLKNFERTWKRSQSQRSGNEKSETRSSEKLDMQNLKTDRVEKISQFRRIADFELIVKQLEEGCQKCMSSPLLLTDSILGLNCYPNILVCLTIIINPLYASINSPLQVYETYLTDNIIYFCVVGGCKASSLNQKFVTESNFKAC